MERAYNTREHDSAIACNLIRSDRARMFASASKRVAKLSALTAYIR